MTIAAAKAAITAVLSWIVTTVKGKAIIKSFSKIAFLGFFMLAMAASGVLPMSPFRNAIPHIYAIMNRIPYVRYIYVFVPIEVIVLVTGTWLTAIIAFHIIKVILRKGRILR